MSWKKVLKNILILKGPRAAILSDIINIVAMFIKKLLKGWKKLKALKLCTNMQSISVLLDTAKFAGFWLKNADASRTQGLGHLIHTFSVFSLSKV